MGNPKVKRKARKPRSPEITSGGPVKIIRPDGSVLVQEPEKRGARSRRLEDDTILHVIPEFTDRDFGGRGDGTVGPYLTKHSYAGIGDAKPVQIVSRRNQPCHVCDGRVHVGQVAWWDPVANVVRHEGCTIE